MIRFTQQDLTVILAEFLGKPWQRGGRGPEVYDCYGLVLDFMNRLGAKLPDQSHDPIERWADVYIRLDRPRPWSLVTFTDADLRSHIGLCLPGGNQFLHCPEQTPGGCRLDDLARKPWSDPGYRDGFWWPRSTIETIVLLSPTDPKKRAWQFVRAGRTLETIIAEDIAEGRDVKVQAFLDGQLVPQADWPSVAPLPLQQLVIKPVFGDGRQWMMMGGMMAMAMFAPQIMSMAAPNFSAYATSGYATMGAQAAYKLAMAAIPMVGGLALNALVGPKESDADPSQNYQWNPVTTMRPGAIRPLIYGRWKVKGNILCSYATCEVDTDTNPVAYLKPNYPGSHITSSRNLYHFKVGFGDGPIAGPVDGTCKVNGRDVDYYDGSTDFDVEHFNGTDDQAASSVLGGFEIGVDQLCKEDEEVTKIFRPVQCDRLAVVLDFPNSFQYISPSDGDTALADVNVRIRIKEVGGSWQTLFSGWVWGKTSKAVRLSYYWDETYDGGSPVSFTEGTQYEVGVTRLNGRHNLKADDFNFGAIQCLWSEANIQRHPGEAYVAIKAAASEEISGSIDFEEIVEGKLLRVYDSVSETWSIEWSDNPAWVAIDVLTRPVITGNGDTVPYEVEYYRRADPSCLILAEWVAFAAWCDEMVDDGDGGTEKRFTFNGAVDSDGDALEWCYRICQSALAAPVVYGTKVGVVIDQPALPVQMFNACNMRKGFSLQWLNTNEAATVYDCKFNDEDGNYETETWPVPLTGAARDIPASMDCFGLTKRSRVWRRAMRQLKTNALMKRTVEIPAALDAVFSKIGDCIYVQHPMLRRATAARIVVVYADGCKVDKALTMGSGDYALLVRTHDGTDEQLTLYDVDSVGGAGNDIVTIDGTWDYTPNVNDIVTFGLESQVIDLYRIKAFERLNQGQCRILATLYDTGFFEADAAAPAIEAQTYDTTRGGMAPSLLPTTAQAISAAAFANLSSADQLTLDGLSFEGDDVDTVTWSNDGEGIKYQGDWYPIAADASGTTAKYIYFAPTLTTQAIDDITLPSGSPVAVEETDHGFKTGDSVLLYGIAGITGGLDGTYTITKVDADNFTLDGTDGDDYSGTFSSGTLANNPAVLASTNDLSILAGTLAFVLCINNAGTACVIAPSLVNRLGQLVSEDDLRAGAFGEWVMEETFENISYEEFKLSWEPTGGGSAEDLTSIESGGDYGGKVLQIILGADTAGWQMRNSIPIQTTKWLYRMRVRIKASTPASGTVLMYAGVKGRNDDDDAWVAYDGSASSSQGNHFRCVAAGVTPDTNFYDYVGYFKGTDSTGDIDAHTNPNDPAVLHSDVRYVRPFVFLTSSLAPSTIQIVGIWLDRIDTTAGISLPGAKHLTDDYAIGADELVGQAFDNAGTAKDLVITLPSATNDKVFEVFNMSSTYLIDLAVASGQQHLLGTTNQKMRLSGKGTGVKLGCNSFGVWTMKLQVGTTPTYVS